MDPAYGSALVKGYERLAAWSDLLDEINVFPVADADTGRNLRISLAPLRLLPERPDEAARRILRAATGNAGNIAAAFLRPLLELQRPEDLAAAVRRGADEARGAVADPKPGTMLTLFDDFANAVPPEPRHPAAWDAGAIVARLERSVAATAAILPEMAEAGVVDAGALGMFIFAEALLEDLTGRSLDRAVTERFGSGLVLAERWRPERARAGYCVSALVRSDGAPDEARAALGACGDSVVVSRGDGGVKVHLHTADRESLRQRMERIGPVVSWREERIATVAPAARAPQPVHIMTDAAGSIAPEDAGALGVTVLDSYLVMGDEAWPETLVAPETLYGAMAAGARVSTAQASVFQRHQSYLSAVSRHRHVLYLCVGSYYTGNFATATAWQAANDPEGRLTVVDSGAAAGRLGIVALAAARHAGRGHHAKAVEEFARAALAQSQEFIFLDQLKFLAAGGRISKTQGFFGDLLRVKPVVSPLPQGATRVGVVHRREDQLAFARRRLEGALPAGSAPLILLQYSDNRRWVEETAAAAVRALLPRASILLRPLSLTSGAHMGPGTWAAAFLPEAFNPPDAAGRGAA
jgi:DegV family protein with EDD domain